MSTGYKISKDSKPWVYCNNVLPDALNLYTVDTVLKKRIENKRG